MTRTVRFPVSVALAGALALWGGGCSVVGEPPTPSGAELFQLCSQCHGAQAYGNRAVNAPGIAGLPQWYIEGQLKKFKLGGRGTHFDDLTGMQMRPMAMSLHNDAEIATIAAYVASLPPHKPVAQISGGNPERGRALYAPCVACHGLDGAGNEALKAPSLTHTDDWYQLSSLKKFKAGIRGTNALDQSGALMRPMALTLADDQAVLDAVAYIVTLQK